MAVRGHMGLGKAFSDVLKTRSDMRPRITLQHWAAVCKGGVGLGSCYLVSGCGVKNQRNQDLLQEAANILRAWQGPWILGGDWNCSPDELAATGWLNLVEGVIHAPGETTCNRRTLDYFVVAKCFTHAVAGIRVIGDSACAPHAAVRLFLKAGARADTVRELRTIPKFPAQLPYGPMGKHWHTVTAELPAELAGPDTAMKQAWLGYGSTIAAVQEELCDLMQADEETRAKHSREEGPSHVRRTIAVKAGGNGLRTNPISRTWRLLGRWLSTTAGKFQATGSMKRHAEWKLLHYEHDTGVRDPALQEAKTEVEAWICYMQEGVFRDRFAAGRMADHAIKRAEAQEAAAAARSYRAYQEWIVGGPSN